MQEPRAALQVIVFPPQTPVKMLVPATEVKEVQDEPSTGHLAFVIKVSLQIFPLTA
jgi:hypothetical protein